MPHFTLQITQQGAVLSAFIGVSEARRNALEQAGQPIPSLVPIRALVDTGASVTAVDPSVLQTLNLTPTGNTTISTPSTGMNPVTVDQYDVSLLVPPAVANQFPLFVRTLPVICCIDLLASQGFHTLLGRDVLAQCILSYNGSMGWFTLAY